jgi:IS5 family transposase
LRDVPTRTSSGGHDLFREGLDALTNMSHPLVKLSRVMDWSRFDAEFSGFNRPVGPPAKHTADGRPALSRGRARSFGRGDSGALGGEPLLSVFSGFEFFPTEMPIDPRTMPSWLTDGKDAKFV